MARGIIDFSDWFDLNHTSAQAAPRKTHSAFLGAGKRVPYSKAGDPAGAGAGENDLKIRALLVDGVLKEWTTGEVHDVTDRSFVVRRAIRLNDALPGDKQSQAENKDRWVWQRGPWILVDRTTGHMTALKLPDYDPGVSQLSWFRDYAAYCGVTATGKSLYAVVAQIAGRRAGAGEETGRVRCRGSSQSRLRPAGLAARSAAHYISSRRHGRSELQLCSRLSGAGGRHGRRRRDA